MAEQTPQQPQGDTLQQDLTAALQTYLAYWPQFLAVVAVALALAGIYSYASRQQEAAELAAWKDLAAARLKAEDDADFAERLAALRREHTGARAVAFARLDEMQVRFDAGELVDARQAAEGFLQQHPQHYFAPQARLEYARLLEWEGKWQAAREEYEAVNRSPREDLAPEAQLGIARCLEQEQRRDEARQAYINLKDRAFEQGWPDAVRTTANLRLVALGGQAAPAEDAPDAPEETDAAEEAEEAEEAGAAEEADAAAEAAAGTETTETPGAPAAEKPEAGVDEAEPDR
jgi:hypothetical protein